MERIGEKISDSRVKEMIEKFLKQGVMESGKDWQPTPGGTPQGAVLSPLQANIYLDPLDHQRAAAGRQMIRYADELMLRAPALRTPAGLLLRRSLSRSARLWTPENAAASSSLAGTSSEVGNGHGRKASRSSRTQSEPRPGATTDGAWKRTSLK